MFCIFSTSPLYTQEIFEKQIESQMIQAISFLKNRDFKKAIKTSNRILDICEKEQVDPIIEGVANSIIGISIFNLSPKDSTLYTHLKRAEDIYSIAVFDNDIRFINLKCIIAYEESMKDYQSVIYNFKKYIKLKNLKNNSEELYIESILKLSEYYTKVKDYNNAIKYEKEALNYYINQNQEIAISSMLWRIGSLYGLEGEYHLAITYLTKAINNTKKIYGEKHINYFNQLLELSSYYSGIENYTKAIYIEEELATNYLKTFGINQGYLDILMELASNHQSLGHIKTSNLYYKEILNLTEIDLNKYYSTHILATEGLARNFANQGKKSEAFTLLNKVVPIVQNTLGLDNNYYTSIVINYCYIYYRFAQYTNAINLATSILDNIDTNTNPGRYYDVLYIFAHSYFAINKYKESIKYCLKALSFLKSHNYFEHAKSNELDLLELLKLNYYLNNDKSYNDIVLKEHSLLKDIIQKRNLELKKSDRLKMINNCFNHYYTTADHIWNAINRNKKIDSTIKKILFESNLILKGLIQNSDYLYNQDTERISNFTISSNDIITNMSENDVAIEFMEYPQVDSTLQYMAVVLKKSIKEPQIVRISNQYIINYDTIQDKSIIQKEIWTIISDSLISPNDNIYFSAAGKLHQIPIESLPIGDGRIMSDVYNMHRLSSTRELALKKEPTTYKKAVLYGGLNYDMTNEAMITENAKYQTDSTYTLFASRGLLEDSIRGYKWTNLNNTKMEVEYISEQIQQNGISTKVFQGNEGSEESFKALSGKGYNIIHIATHGFFFPEPEAKRKDYFQPIMLSDDLGRNYAPADLSLFRTELVLSGGNRAWQGDSIPDHVEDGILTAHEIKDLDLRGADLVVLSACNTGQGEITSEGIFGLQRAFKMAGAQTIIMSLTEVDDQTTMAMMNKLYSNLMEGQSKHDAFYNAQRYIRSIKPDPKYWRGWIMLD